MRPLSDAPSHEDAVHRLERHRGRRLPKWLATRRAAVSIILRRSIADARTEVLLVERAARPGDPWSGDMAFPGGLAAPGDASLRDTAVRETREEIGLDLAVHGRSLTTLSEQLTLSPDRRALVIRPFVFELAPGAPAPGTSSEVVGTHWIDLAFFDRETRHTTLSRRFLGIPMRFECHRFEGRAIWGLTLRMIHDLRRRVRRR